MNAPRPAEIRDDERPKILDLLGPTPVAVDEIFRQSGHPAASVQLILLELVLARRLERHAGARISAA